MIEQRQSHQQPAASRRGYSFDLPSDGSMSVTEEQLTALGSIRLHLWKSLRFKLQRFFVVNVTNPQVGSTFPSLLSYYRSSSLYNYGVSL